MIILGLSGSSHDSSAALIADGEIVAACEEERYCRKKHAPGELPVEAARACMRKAKISPKDIELVTYYFNPDLYDEEITAFLSKSIRESLIKEGQDLSGVLRRSRKHRDKANSILEALGLKSKLIYIDHHLTHAASAFYLSGLEESMILTLDNIGELTSSMLAVGKENQIIPLKKQQVPHSLGMLYATITDYLGFRPFYDEGKVMALASYGKPTIPLEEIIEIGEGEFRIKDPFLIREVNPKREFSEEFVKKYGPPRSIEEEITKRHVDLASSIQFAVEEATIKLVKWMYAQTGIRNLCLGGGVVLNCSMNGKIAELPFIESMYIFPAAGDSGTSVGSAVYAYVQHTGKRPSRINHAGLGESWNNDEVKKALEQSNLSFREVADSAIETGKILLEEKAVCWFNGPAELGPRALGHRSILALPDNIKLKDFINREVKHREMWRPLCPSVDGESIETYAPGSSNGRFMIVAYNASDYAKKRIPGVIHTDGTMRVQAVYSEESSDYQRLLKYVGQSNGNPVLLNTSFNLKTEPIVNSPSDAIKSFLIMPIKTLVMENFIATKN